MLISLPLTLVVLGWLLWRQRELLLTYQWNIRPVFVAYAFGIYSVVLLMSTQTWGWITGAITKKQVGYWSHLRAFCISAIGKRLPGTIWYVAWRAQIYNEQGISAKFISLASGIEAAVSMLSAVIVSGLFALPILMNYELGVWGLAVTLLLSLVMIHPSVVGWFRRRLGMQNERIPRRQLLLWTISYVVIRILVGLNFFVMINIFYPIGVENLPYVIGSQSFVAGLTMLLLFFPTNFGFAEVSLSLLLSNIMPSSIAVILVVMNRILTIIFEFVWSFFVVAKEIRIKRRS